MVIIGAKGHASEVLSIVVEQFDHICFFDDLLREMPEKLFEQFQVLKTEDQLEAYFKQDPVFVLGVGNPHLRYQLASKATKLGGKLTSVIAQNASIGRFNTKLGVGLNVMHGVLISENVTIEEGVLVNAGANLHHDSRVGRYTEISPGAKILGGASVGEFCQIGANASVLHRVKVGNNVVVGAGAVVTKDLEDNSLAVGVPAKVIKKLA